ncbi:MAG: 50S ribosomal protein L24 [Candidatus Altiarchaeales archaeon]|nr:50S ribosomal protein L24 [Candidatus Altiarchaeales archaeon]
MKSISSKKPRKQRKLRFNAPLHRRHKMVASHLSHELGEKYHRRSLPVRKGDTIRVMRGGFKDHVGEIMRVDLKTLKVYVEGITIKKADGTDIEKPVDPSNIMITELYMEDKERRNMLERKIE